MMHVIYSFVWATLELEFVTPCRCSSFAICQTLAKQSGKFVCIAIPFPNGFASFCNVPIPILHFDESQYFDLETRQEEKNVSNQPIFQNIDHSSIVSDCDGHGRHAAWSMQLVHCFVVTGNILGFLVVYVLFALNQFETLLTFLIKNHRFKIQADHRHLRTLHDVNSA